MSRAVLVVGLALLASSCATSSPSVATSPAVPTTRVLTFQPENGSNVAGLVKITYTPGARSFSVTVSATGLPPGTTHPEHFHLGGCASNGKIVQALPDLVADSSGTATVSATILAVFQASGWYVNIHQGPTLKDPGGGTVIACADEAAP
ncbi:MAG: CHRD domain-containing protein [Candidatus Dormibacteria bacterium]